MISPPPESIIASSIVPFFSLARRELICAGQLPCKKDYYLFIIKNQAYVDQKKKKKKLTIFVVGAPFSAE